MPSSKAWKWTSFATSVPLIGMHLIFIATGLPRRSAGFRSRIFGIEEGKGQALSHHLGRALQMTNILRDLDEDAKMGRLYLPKEVLAGAGIANGDVGKVLAHPRLGEACAAVVARAERHFAEASAVMARCGRRNVRSPRIMASVYRALLEELVDARLGAAASGGSPVQASISLGRPALRRRVMSRGIVHIVGAGLAGLSAAVGLVGSGREIVVHELARHAGGRCRSYFEPALGLSIDNGNHLLLSANHAALAFLKTIGSEENLVGPEEAEFAFADLASGDRWVAPSE